MPLFTVGFSRLLVSFTQLHKSPSTVFLF